jgi:thioesterase domain-containing protein/SAM-dependent methyltransferase
VISRACEAFRIELPLRKFFEATTVAQMAEVVSDAKSSGAAEVSFVRIRGGGSGPPLFWLHGVQGVIFWYQNLADYIDPDHAIYGIVPLKLHTASRHRLRIEDMAAQYVSEIRALQPEGPYFLAGPSAGGIWAFEVARQLDAQRQKVGLVALLDTPCPIRLKDGLLSLSKRVLGYICKAALLGPKRGSKYFLGKAKGSRLGRMFNGFQAAAEELKLIAGFGEEVSRDREFRPLHGPQPAQKEIAAACQWALAHYTPRTYPGRLVLFWAEQPESSVPRFSEFDRRTGWRDIAPGRLEIHRISCIHRNLLAEPHIRVVARRLNEYLEKASPTAPTELRKNSKLGTKSARQTQKRESASSDSSRLLDMGDCKSPDWVRINKDFRKEEYRLQPLWFRFLFRLDFVRKRLGYDRESRLWEYPWAIRSADLERGMRVLDLGSGGSAFPMLLSRYGCQVHASDPSLNYGRGLRPLRWENQVARRLGIPGLWGLPPARMGSRSAVDYAADPIQKLRYRNGYFDRIFCISVMEHIPVRDWASCMAEMSRVLIDGGRLVMTVSMMMPQANERWFEKLLVEPSLELVGSIDYQTPISLEEAQRRHPGQAYETLGLLWEKAQTISPKQTE